MIQDISEFFIQYDLGVCQKNSTSLVISLKWFPLVFDQFIGLNYLDVEIDFYLNLFHYFYILNLLSKIIKNFENSI